MSTPERPEELRAPEVVRPRQRKPAPPAKKKQESTSAGSGKDKSTPPPIKNAKQASTPKTDSQKSRAQKKQASPPPIPEKKPQAKPTPPKPKLQKPPPSPKPVKKGSGAGGWIAGVVICGVLLLIWYGANTETSTQRSSQPNRSVSHTRPSPAPHTIPPQPLSDSSGTVSAAPRPPSRPPVLRLGALAVAAIAVAADGRRYRVTGPASLRLTDRISGQTSTTNAVLPCRWGNLAAGRYELTADVQGYKQNSPTVAEVSPSSATDVSLLFAPLRSSVRFLVSPTNAYPTIYQGNQSLGKAPGPIELDPYVQHTLLFRAPGWRDHSQTISIPKPGGAFRAEVEMERIQSGLRVSIRTSNRNPPTSGTIIIAHSKPFKVSLPFETSRIPLEGPVKVYLSVEGSSGYDTQDAVLQDGKTADVVFPIGKQPKRTSSTQAPGRSLQEPAQPTPLANAPASFFTRGSHERDVLRVQGKPSDVSSYSALGYEQWNYGYSTVQISTRTRRVLSWQNQGNLKVKMTPGANVTTASHFSPGSHADDVIRIQGTPKGISSYPALGYEQWDYGYSSVKISTRDSRVLNWNDQGNLKVKMVPGRNVSRQPFFTRGSHQDDVLRLQGTPDNISDYSALGYVQWDYGYSSVKLSARTRSVLAWDNKGNLKVRLSPGNQVSTQNTYTRGSHQDDVLRLQGTPDGISDYSALGYEQWDYGYSSVKISSRNRRVLEWNNAGNLKAR